MPYWACAQLETRRERTALHFLRLNGFTTYCPRIRTERPSRERERSTWLFPGYAFVWIELQWHAARWSPGVIRLVSGGGAEPAKAPVSVIEGLKSRERNGLVVLPSSPRLKRGDPVQILHGPFAGQLALYDGQRPRERVMVLLALLGSVQRVELAMRSVKLAPKPC
jgi:transcription antitermination factor NusG